MIFMLDSKPQNPDALQGNRITKMSIDFIKTQYHNDS